MSYSPRANLYAKLLMLGFLITVAGTIVVVIVVYRSSYFTGEQEAIAQPVMFSHKHHVGQLGIDCRYCHQSVETSASAGMPSTELCMNCHSHIWTGSPVLASVVEHYIDRQPLRWRRVNNLPDYVFFNHSIHVNKGVGCETCHGRVDTMPQLAKTNSLHMRWCLGCHRHPENFLRPKTEVFAMNWHPDKPQAQLGDELMKAYHVQSKTDCYTCHR